jgi:Na+/melibiose symporter-like transporter
MGSTVLWLVVFYKAMAVYEKRTIYFMGLLCYCPFPAMLFVINDVFIQRTGVWIVYAVSVGSGIGVATSFLLPWAMLPDTIDQSEVTSGASRASSTATQSAYCKTLLGAATARHIDP